MHEERGPALGQSNRYSAPKPIRCTSNKHDLAGQISLHGSPIAQIHVQSVLPLFGHPSPILAKLTGQLVSAMAIGSCSGGTMSGVLQAVCTVLPIFGCGPKDVMMPIPQTPAYVGDVSAAKARMDVAAAEKLINDYRVRNGLGRVKLEVVVDEDYTDPGRCHGRAGPDEP